MCTKSYVYQIVIVRRAIWSRSHLGNRSGPEYLFLTGVFWCWCQRSPTVRRRYHTFLITDVVLGGRTTRNFYYPSHPLPSKRGIHSHPIWPKGLDSLVHSVDVDTTLDLTDLFLAWTPFRNSKSSKGLRLTITSGPSANCGFVALNVYWSAQWI